MSRSGALAGLLLALAGCAGAPVARPPKDEARALLAANQPERATELLERLHGEDPADLEVARWLVDAHLKAGTAGPLARRLASPWPAREEVRHYMLGLLLFGRSAGEARAAVGELEQAIALAPGNAELHYRLGLVLLETEAYPPAAAALRKVRELAPGHRAVLLPLSRALARTGDRDGAVEALRLLVRSGPTPAEVKTARALMAEIDDPFGSIPKAAQARLDEGLKWLHDYDAPQPAIVAFEEILRDFPDLGPVHALLGLAHQRLDDGGRAMEAFRRAIELQPGSGRNHFYLGEVYRARQRPETAREHYGRALALDPLLDDAYLRLGDVALDRRELEEARDAYFALAHLQPGSISAHGKLAAVLQLQGELGEADRELRAALELGPDSLELQLRLGLLHAERSLKAKGAGERRQASAEAARWLRRVLDAQPENALASRTLETLRAKE